MPTVRVEAERPDPERTEGSDVYTPDATSTAFKMDLSLRETPQTITVIPQQVIRDFNLTDTRDILDFTPGVYVQSERNTEAYWFQSRGFEMQTQYDGVPSPNGFGARGNSSPDSAFIDRVDVLYGAAGLLAGAGNPGGVVNLAHKTPGTEFASSFEIGADSFGGYRLVADVGGPITNHGIGGRLIALHEEKKLFVDDTSGKHNGFYGSLQVPLLERTDVLIGVTYEETVDAQFGPHYGIPSNPDGTLVDAPRERNFGATWAHQDTYIWGGFAHVRHEYTNGWKLEARLAYDTTKFDALEAVPNREETPELTLWTQEEGWDNESLGLDVFAQGPVEWFGREHTLMFGVNGAKRDELQDPYRFTLEPLAVIDPETYDARNHLDPYSVPWDSIHWGNGKRKQYGFFGAGRFELADSVHTIIGARVSWTEAEWEGVDSADESGVVTPYAGITWDFARHLTAYASYSEIFQPQDLSIRTINGDSLDPVVGENLEAGLKLELFDGGFNAALAVFQLDQTNLAEPDYSGEWPGFCGGTLDPCSRAAGLVRSEGVDFTLSGKIAAGWQIIGGINFLEQKHESGEAAGTRYDTLTPERTLHLAASYSSPDDKWSIGASVKYQSDVFTEGELFWALDEDGEIDDLVPYRIEQDAFTLFGLFARYSPSEKLSINLALENLTDESYLSGISWPAHGQVYGVPRNATLTLVGKF